MDQLSSCKDKLAYFRIRELKDVLTQLGLAKQGKKQELVDRVLSLLSDEQGTASRSHSWAKKNSIGKDGVAKIIDDTYRKMQLPGATDLASKGQSSSDIDLVKPKEEVVNSYQLKVKVRCPCGSSLLTSSVVQCEDSSCQVLQHIDCVIIPEKPVEGIQPELPQHFYCELCRVKRADPFWLTVSHPLLPVKMVSCSIASDGSNVLQCLEKIYPLSRVDKDLLQRNEYDLQAWCILFNDKVPFRMQWPQHSDLQVNGIPIRTTNRPRPQLLGINGRDDGHVITTCSKEGPNKISVSRRDQRTFCFGIRIAKQRTVQQVLSMVPKEADGESFDDAITRVCRCVGGDATENADSDSDLEVVADSVVVNLRCPMSGSRIKIAGRFKPCVHMACFDLETFVELNQRSRKWQCPICLKNYSLENIIIDPYFNRITSLMRNCGEDVNDIEVKPNGSWRAKSEGGCMDLAKWHLPDGSLCAAPAGEVDRDLGISKQIKEEDVSEGHTGLKLGIKKNQNGNWELSKPEDTRPPSSGNYVQENLGNHFRNIVPMSSSATGSYRDGEDPSVNQDGGGNFDFSLNNIHDLDSISLSFDPTYNIGSEIPVAPSRDADVIVLSDSDEDNETMISAKDAVILKDIYGTGLPYPTNQPVLEETYPEDAVPRTGGTSCLGPFINDSDDFGMPLWPSYPQTGPGFQLFGGSDDGLVDVQQDALPPLGFPSNNDLPEGASHAQDFSTCPSNAEANESLVDNPLAYDSEDPSLQIFLPSQPADVPVQADMDDHTEMGNGADLDNWITLSLGAPGEGHVDPASKNGRNSKQHFTPQENDTASLLLSMNGTSSNKSSSNVRRSEGPFSHPRQPRSVRQRLYLSIDTDSD